MTPSFKTHGARTLVFLFILFIFFGTLSAQAQTRPCTPADISEECTNGGAGATTNAPLPGTTVRPCTPGDDNCTPGQTTSQPIPNSNNNGYRPAPAPTANFVPLTGIPGVTNTGDFTFGSYMNALFRLLIGIGALLAVIKIVLAGIKYMGSEGFSSKGEAKEDIQNALLGLLIILTTVIILYTINPDILKFRLATDLIYIPPYVETPAAPQTTCGGSTGTVCECTEEALKSVGCALADSQVGDFEERCERDNYGYLERQPSGTWQCIPNTPPPPTTTVEGEVVDTVVKNYLCGPSTSCLVFDENVTDESVAEAACIENGFDSGLESAQGPASNSGLYYYCK